jgi:hypothetical protein
MRSSHAWQQGGTTALWRYTDHQRYYPGWHLSSDAAGCASLQGLIDAMLADGTGAARTVQVTPPSPSLLAVPNNRRAAWEAPGSVRIGHDAAVDGWVWEHEGDRVSLRLDAGALALLRQGVDDIAAGRGDHAMGSGAAALWFWWWPSR